MYLFPTGSCFLGSSQCTDSLQAWRQQHPLTPNTDLLIVDDDDDGFRRVHWELKLKVIMADLSLLLGVRKVLGVRLPQEGLDLIESFETDYPSLWQLKSIP